MEAIAQILQPYKFLIGETASYVTMLQFLSGIVICKDIYKQQNSKGVIITPFVGGIVMGLLVLKYGLLLSDPAMIKVNVVAIFLNVFYSMFYCYYSDDRIKNVLKPAAYWVLLAAIVLGYAQVEYEDKLEYRFGLIITVVGFILIGSPFMDLKNIIANKDASSIPFPLTFMGSIVTFLWLLYGLVLENEFMIIQNFIGFLMCISQLILIYMYPKCTDNQNQTSKPLKKD